ncbi:cytochrome P450 [Schizophyllum commune Tattone D]|nr:cytochrome P450 [Schizophyllum commune Tattone D]
MPVPRMSHRPPPKPIFKGDLDLVNRYGNIVKFDGAFGERRLLITDPKALHHIMQASGYTYIRSEDRKEPTRTLLGKGDDHRRQRKILMPSFGSIEAHSYVPSFASKAAQVRPAKARFAPTDLEVLAVEALALIPRPLKRWWNDHVPNKRRAYMKRCREVAEGVARELVQRQRPAVSAGEGVQRNVLSRLVAANAAADPKARLTEDEVYAQLLTILLAGHETTATSLSWALLELAQAPPIQDRLRAEIRGVRGENGSKPRLEAEDIRAMPFLNAVVQEVLRFHNSVIDTARTATQDDVIPLSDPLLDRKGRPIYEVASEKKC